MIRRGSRVRLHANEGTVLYMAHGTGEALAVVEWDRPGTVPTPWPVRELVEL